jgi:hypothetical protein
MTAIAHTSRNATIRSALLEKSHSNMVSVLSNPKTGQTGEKFSGMVVGKCEVCVANLRQRYLLDGAVLAGEAT